MKRDLGILWVLAAALLAGSFSMGSNVEARPSDSARDRLQAMRQDRTARTLQSTLADIRFIRLATRYVLGREPYPNEFVGFFRGLQSRKITRLDVIRGLRRDAQNQAAVADLYKELLRRRPDPSGIATYVGGMNAGLMTRDTVREAILGSEEFRNLRARDRDAAADPRPPAGPATTLDDLANTVRETGVTPPAETGPEPPRAPDPGPETPPATPVDTKVESEARVIEIPAKDAGAIEFETSGITHTNEENSVGAEWIFFTMHGEGFRRALLLHAAGEVGRGHPRAIRSFYEADGKGELDMEIADDNLPGWHKWRIEWGGGTLRFLLDGKRIGRAWPFAGKRPTKAWIGGNDHPSRNFKGTWRNLTVE